MLSLPILASLALFQGLAQAAGSVCTGGLYGIIVPVLSSYPPAQSFCSSKFPLPAVTSTAITTTTSVVSTVVSTVVTTTITAPPHKRHEEVNMWLDKRATTTMKTSTKKTTTTKSPQESFLSVLVSEAEGVISTACSCIEHRSTVTVIRTSTTVSTSTSTSTSTATAVATVYSYSPANIRIEYGAWGVEGYDIATQRTLTTPSGGTHECDGTNGGANPTPGETASTRMDVLAVQNGLTVDGTFDSEFDDFFITQIGTTETSTEFWGLLEAYTFTPVAGCMTEVQPADQILWAFNAFNANSFFELGFPGQGNDNALLIPAGSSTTVSVIAHNGGGGTNSPPSGASIQTQDGTVYGTTDATGTATLTFSIAGTYSLKAVQGSNIRSNAITITVV